MLRMDSREEWDGDLRLTFWVIPTESILDWDSLSVDIFRSLRTKTDSESLSALSVIADRGAISTDFGPPWLHQFAEPVKMSRSFAPIGRWRSCRLWNNLRYASLRILLLRGRFSVCSEDDANQRKIFATKVVVIDLRRPYFCRRRRLYICQRRWVIVWAVSFSLDRPIALYAKRIAGDQNLPAAPFRLRYRKKKMRMYIVVMRLQHILLARQRVNPKHVVIGNGAPNHEDAPAFMPSWCSIRTSYR